MILYRGDSIFNDNTLPGQYRTEGIRSKTFGKGDPAYIKREGLISAIRKHVRPNRSIPSDLAYYDTTDFISFSENGDRALYWLSRRGTVTLQPTNEPYKETSYLFVLQIDLKKADYLGDGIYSYAYKCNPQLRKPDAPDMMTAIAAAASIAQGCEVCQGGTVAHQLLLIDSEQYLRSKNDATLAKHIEFAHNDAEWLVLPADPIQSGFLRARIPRSDIWEVLHFTNGQTRDPMKYAVLGIIQEVRP